MTKRLILVSFLACICSFAGTITITSPTASQTISGTAFAFTSTLSTLPAAASVEYDTNGEVACIAMTPPWSCNWNTFYIYGGLTHTVTATARDALNNVLATSSPVTFGVINQIPIPHTSLIDCTAAPGTPFTSTWSGTVQIPLTCGANVSSNTIYVDGTVPAQTLNPHRVITTNFSNGVHNVVITWQDTADQPVANFNATGMIEKQVTFSNGSVPMELRLLPGDEHFLCTTVLSNCTTSVTITGKIFNTDEASTSATFTGVTALYGGVVTTSACSSCSSITVTQSAVGSDYLTFTAANGMTRSGWFHVNTSNVMPHFGNDGNFYNVYTSGKSIFLHSQFQDCVAFTDGAYPNYSNYAKDFQIAGLNMAECGITNGAPSSTAVQATWQAAQQAYVNTTIASIPSPITILLSGDSINRQDSDLFSLTKFPSASWTNPAVQTMVQKWINSNRAFNIHWSDEINLNYGAYPEGGLLNTSNALWGANIVCTTSPNTCTIPVPVEAIMSASTFIITNATQHACLNSDSTTGAVYQNTAVNTSLHLTFTNPCGSAFTDTDTGLIVQQWVFNWFNSNGTTCTSACSLYPTYDAFTQIMSQARAATGTMKHVWDVAGSYDRKGAQGWMGSATMSDFIQIYQNDSVDTFLPQFFNLGDLKSNLSFVYRDKYSVAGANRLNPVSTEGAGVPVNYGYQGYSIPISDCTGSVITTTQDHLVRNVIPWVTRLKVTGSTACNGNYMVIAAPTNTTLKVARSAPNFTLDTCASGCGSNASTATTEDGTVFTHIYQLSAVAGDIFNDIAVNNPDSTCAFNAKRGQTVTFTQGAGASIGAFATSTFYIIAAPFNPAIPSCPGSTQVKIGQLPALTSTGGSAAIQLDFNYKRGVTWNGPANSEVGFRYAFANSWLGTIAGGTSERIYSGAAGYYQNSPGMNRPFFGSTATNDIQISAFPVYQDITEKTWYALSSATLLENRLTKFLFQPRLAGPDYGTFVECTIRQGTPGNLLACVSLLDGVITRTIDLTSIVQSGQPTIKYCGSGRGGITVSTIASGVTSDVAVFDADACNAVAYVGVANAALEYTKPLISVRLADVTNATKVVVQYAYNPLVFTAPSVSAIALPQAVDCGTGTSCALPVDINIGKVYYQILYLNAAGSVIATGDVQKL